MSSAKRPEPWHDRTLPHWVGGWARKEIATQVLDAKMPTRTPHVQPLKNTDILTSLSRRTSNVCSTDQWDPTRIAFDQRPEPTPPDFGLNRVFLFNIADLQKKDVDNPKAGTKCFVLRPSSSPPQQFAPLPALPFSWFLTFWKVKSAKQFIIMG